MKIIQHPQCEKPKISITISTYYRHQGLLRLLDSLDQQKIDTDIVGSWRVVIIDNSPDFNCRTLLDDKTYRFDYVLCHEPQSGISYARNRGVKESAGADFVVFVDDDEYADDDWLMQLLNCQAKYQCAVVQGPVPTVFEHPVKPWYRYFHQHSRDLMAKKETGERLISMATNNALVAIDAIRDIEGPFDPKLALSGGEDSLLGRQLVARGHEIIWCREAVVHDVIPPERTNLKWCMKRSFHKGNLVTIIALNMKKSKAMWLRRLVVSLGRVFQGMVFLPGFLLPIDCRLNGPCMIAYGLGSFTGLYDQRFEGYKRPDAK